MIKCEEGSPENPKDTITVESCVEGEKGVSPPARDLEYDLTQFSEYTGNGDFLYFQVCYYIILTASCKDITD